MWKERLEDTPYNTWLRQHYHLAHMDNGGHRVSLHSDDAIPGERRLTENLIFLGHDDYEVEQAPDGFRVKLVLFWRPLAPSGAVPVSLKIMDSAYHVWGQAAGVLQWSPDHKHTGLGFVADERAINVSPGTPPGEYQISVAVPAPDEDSQGIFVEPIALPRRFATREELDMSHSVDVRLADRAALLGYRTTDPDIGPGDSIDLTLFWQALEKMKQNYTVFVHLQAADGALVAQQDNQPVAGFYPTSRWVTGEIVRDPYRLTVPQDAPPGPYRLLVGLYDAATGVRLPISAPGQPAFQDAVELTGSGGRQNND